MTTCPACGAEGPSEGAFCQHCGSPLRATSERACSACLAPNPPGTNFCHNCGERIEAAPAAPAASAATEAPAPTARLVSVSRDGTDGVSYPITSDQLDIGRSDCGLRLDDPHLAPRHARITRRAGQYLLAPLESRNGIYVRIREPTEIQDGDHFLIGKQVLRFELVPDVEKALRPAVEHDVVLFGTPVKAPWARLRQLTSAGTTRDVYHLTRGDPTLGREQGDIVFADDEFMSRRHVQIQLRSAQVTLQDLGSSNGTYLRLRAAHPLSPGDMVRIGDELLRFELR